MERSLLMVNDKGCTANRPECAMEVIVQIEEGTVRLHLNDEELWSLYSNIRATYIRRVG